MSEASFDEIFTTYYRSPSPAGAVAALESEARGARLDAGRQALIVYFFAMIAREYPPIIRDYEAIFDRQPTPLVLRVLAQVNDAETRRFLAARLDDERFQAIRDQMRAFVKDKPMLVDPLATGRVDPPASPIRTALDLDLLWAEFFVTGNTVPVVRIIDVLDWPDVVRRRIERGLRFPSIVRFLGTLVLFSRPDWQPSVPLHVIRDLDVDIDLHRRQISTPEDLDLLLLGRQSSMVAGTGRWNLITPYLSETQRRTVATKSAAFWSLGSNATDHLSALETCEMQLSTRSGRATLALLEIAAVARLAGGDRREAAAWANRYLELSPENDELRRLLHRADESLRGDSDDIGAGPPDRRPVRPPPTLDEVMAIIHRFEGEPVAPLSALGADQKTIRDLLDHELSRRLADPAAPEAWKAKHAPTEPLPSFEREPMDSWRARREPAEHAFVEVEKFVPDSDALAVRRFLASQHGEVEAMERDQARSVLKTVRRNRHIAHRRVLARHHDNMLWHLLAWEHPLLGLLFFMGLFLLSWTIWFAIALALATGDSFYPTQPLVVWIALFAAGWLISTIVPLLVIDEEAAPFILTPALFLFPAVVAAVEVGVLFLIGWT